MSSRLLRRLGEADTAHGCRKSDSQTLAKIFRQIQLPGKNPPRGLSSRFSCPGFSLLEVLVATAVLSILMVMLMGLVSSASALWRQSENRAEAFREARAALGIISRDLSSIFVGPQATNHFLFGQAAGEALARGGSVVFDGDRQAMFFLTLLPPAAQEEGSLSDICQVGYFLAFDRTAISQALPGSQPSMNLYRYFLSSNQTFQRLSANGSVVFTNNLLPTDNSVELLARNVREFRIVPLVLSNGTYTTNFSPSPDRPLPDVLEISLSAVNQEAARRFPRREDWVAGPPGLTSLQQTFTTRIRINQPGKTQ